MIDYSDSRYILESTALGTRVLLRRSALEAFVATVEESEPDPPDHSMRYHARTVGCFISGLDAPKIAEILDPPDLCQAAELTRGQEAAGIASPAHPSWDEPCYLITIVDYKYIDALKNAFSGFSDKQPPELAATLRPVIDESRLPKSVRAAAVLILGTSHYVSDQRELARPLFEEALSLGQDSGWAVIPHSLIVQTANALGSYYFTDLASNGFAAEPGSGSRAHADVGRLQDLITRFHDSTDFHLDHFRALLLVEQAILLSLDAVEHEEAAKLEEALAKYGELISLCRVSDDISADMRTVWLQVAYEKSGACCYLGGDREAAIQYWEEASTYCAPESDELAEIERLIKVTREGGNIFASEGGERMPKDMATPGGDGTAQGSVHKLAYEFQTLRFGTIEDRLAVLCRLAHVAPDTLLLSLMGVEEAVVGHPLTVPEDERAPLIELLWTRIRDSDAGAPEQWWACLALADLGERSNETVGRLLNGAGGIVKFFEDNPESDPFGVMCLETINMTLRALSMFSNDDLAASAITQVFEGQGWAATSRTKVPDAWPCYALAALGDERHRERVQYWSQRSDDPSVQLAVDYFGKATWDELMDLQEQSKARREFGKKKKKKKKKEEKEKKRKGWFGSR